MFCVYVLKNHQNKIYIGHTNNFERRIAEHNNNASDFTKHKGPWRLIYSESFNTRAEAMRREKQLKSSRGRNWIRTTIINKASVS